MLAVGVGPTVPSGISTPRAFSSFYRCRMVLLLRRVKAARFKGLLTGIFEEPKKSIGLKDALFSVKAGPRFKAYNGH